MPHERIICPHGSTISTCRCTNAAKHTRVVACPYPQVHAGQPVTAGWTADGLRRTDDGQSVYPEQLFPGLKQRPGDQPLPVPNKELDIQSQVIEDIVERRKVGISRYGTALQPFNGRDALQDAYEEAMDLAIYLKQCIVERDMQRSAIGGGG